MSCITLLVFIVFLISIYGYPRFMNLIPNGRNVKLKCYVYDHAEGTFVQEVTDWPMVGHVYPDGFYIRHADSERNQFGRNFSSLKKWTADLCNADSDGDGMTNGEELGFPDCSRAENWTRNPTSVTLGLPKGHPGVCEINDKSPTDTTDCHCLSVVPTTLHPTTTT